MSYNGRHSHDKVFFVFFRNAPNKTFSHKCVKVCDIKNLLPLTLPHHTSKSCYLVRPSFFSVDINYHVCLFLLWWITVCIHHVKHTVRATRYPLLRDLKSHTKALASFLKFFNYCKDFRSLSIKCHGGAVESTCHSKSNYDIESWYLPVQT